MLAQENTITLIWRTSKKGNPIAYYNGYCLIIVEENDIYKYGIKVEKPADVPGKEPFIDLYGEGSKMSTAYSKDMAVTLMINWVDKHPLSILLATTETKKLDRRVAIPSTIKAKQSCTLAFDKVDTGSHRASAKRALVEARLELNKLIKELYNAD